MSKVLVERSRIGGKSDRKGRASKNIDDAPTKQSMKSQYKDRKSLNENLNPLKRFLHSKVGQSWNKVYSEISENLKTTNAVQQHVRDHVWDFVHKHVEVEDKKVLAQRKYRGTYYELRNNELYVCPKSGILKKYSAEKRVRKPYDSFNQNMQYLCSEKSRLVMEDGVVYKFFQDKKTEEWTIMEKANATHARHDFKARYTTWNKNSILRFFHEFEKKINFKNPYIAAYVDLINKAVVEKKVKAPPSTLWKVGEEVEVSEDSGKTWISGFINRMQESNDLNMNRPTFWISLTDTRNVMISPYISRMMLRPKKK